LGPNGIRPEAFQRLKDYFSQGITFRRLAQADEVANAVVFLASALSSFITAAAIPVDGGYNQIRPTASRLVYT